MPGRAGCVPGGLCAGLTLLLLLLLSGLCVFLSLWLSTQLWGPPLL